MYHVKMTKSGFESFHSQKCPLQKGHKEQQGVKLWLIFIVKFGKHQSSVENPKMVFSVVYLKSYNTFSFKLKWQ